MTAPRGGCVLRLVQALGLACALTQGPAWALDPHRLLEHLNHVSWRQRDGAPNDITALAQTGDGYLWLGTQSGLSRFDGVSFTPYVPPAGQALLSNRVYLLFTDRQGRLWICYTFGGVSVIDADGRLSHFPAGDVLPAGTVLSMAQRPDGSIWGLTSRGLFRYDGAGWRAVPLHGRSPPSSIAIDRHGTAWLAGPDGIDYVRANRDDVEHFAIDRVAGGGATLIAAAASLWVRAGGRLTEYALSDDFKPRVLRRIDVSDASTWLLLDRHGSLLFDTDGGFRRIGAAPLQQAGRLGIELFREPDGLTGDWARAVLDDHDGNLWIATNGGLDRFRDTRFHTLAAVPGRTVDYVVEASDHRSVWLGSGMGLRRIGAQPRVFSELGRDEVSAIARATDGSIDVATVKGLWQVDGGRITRLPDPPVPLSDAHAAQALLRDGQGRLWLSQRAAGVFVLDGQHWKADPVAGLDPGAAVFMYRAPDDVLWFAYPGNRLARLDHGLLRYFDAADGLAVGDVLAIASVDGQLWIGGEKGVAHFEGRGAGRGGGRFRMLGGVAGGRFGGVSGIVGGNDGALWLNGASGIQRIAQGQLTPFLAGADSAVDYEQFDDSDGTGGAYARFRPLPSISASDDGQLWFLNSRKIVTINPAHIVRNKVPPAIRMTALDAGGIPYLAAGMPDTVPPARVRLPQHTQSLSIGYTALSLSTPERIRFRYRLDGVDTGWQEAGTRRTAYYTNLAPGSYRFHLSAANEDGVWNTTGTALDFTISPAYYQTVWFRALLGAAALVLLWALYRQRSRLVEARRQGQLAERERIARELHDTLLQSTQGLIFGFHAAVGGLPRELPARDAMERILDRAETVLKEARDGVHGLRSEDRDAASDGENSLVKRILARLPAAGTMPVHVVLKGQPQPLKAALYEDACAIAGEAIGNAMRHSHGSLITLTIQYGCRDLSFSVVDDGVGLPEEVRVTGGRSGHWGLAGMRERAGRLRATLVVDGARGQGAEVRWRVPAAVAYSAGRCAGRHGWAYLRCRWDHRFEKRD